MRPSVDWEMIPIPEESAPPEPSATEFIRRPTRQSPDVFGRLPESRVPETVMPEIVQ